RGARGGRGLPGAGAHLRGGQLCGRGRDADRGLNPQADTGSSRAGARRLRTPGESSAAQVATSTRAPQASSAFPTPSSAAAGAASISPIGPNINEPSASYELTRDSDSGGISRCMVVIHSTPNTSKQTPSTNAPATVTQSGAPAPSRKYGSAAGRQSSAPTRIGRRGRTRSDTT